LEWKCFACRGGVLRCCSRGWVTVDGTSAAATVAARPRRWAAGGRRGRDDWESGALGGKGFSLEPLAIDRVWDLADARTLQTHSHDLGHLSDVLFIALSHIHAHTPTHPHYPTHTLAPRTHCAMHIMYIIIYTHIYTRVYNDIHAGWHSGVVGLKTFSIGL